MIVYTCHQCKAQLQSPDSMSGSFITCPGCKSTLIVPGAPYRPASPATTTADAPAVALTAPSVPAPAPAGFSTSAATVPFDAASSVVPPPVPPVVETPVTAAAFSSPASVASGAGMPPSPPVPPMPPPFGATYPNAGGQQAKVSRLIYVILAIFLGWVGVHNFAAGRNSTAIVQLITGLAGFLLSPCTFGLSLLAPFATYVWAIVDAVTQTRDGDGVVMP